MEKEKMLNLVSEALNKSGGDTSKAADILMAMAEDEAEGQLATKH